MQQLNNISRPSMQLHCMCSTCAPHVLLCFVHFIHACQAQAEEEREKLLEEVKKAKTELQQKTAIISGLNVSHYYHDHIPST